MSDDAEPSWDQIESPIDLTTVPVGGHVEVLVDGVPMMIQLVERDANGGMRFREVAN